MRPFNNDKNGNAVHNKWLLSFVILSLSACGGGSGGGDNSDVDNPSYKPKTFYLEGNDVGCVEYDVRSKSTEINVGGFGAMIGYCPSNGIAQCELYNEDVTERVIYYTGIIDHLRQGCNHISGSFSVLNSAPEEPIYQPKTFSDNKIGTHKICTEYWVESLEEENTIAFYPNTSEGSCSISERIAKCEQTLLGTNIEEITYYYWNHDNPRDPEDFRASCDLVSGEFSIIEQDTPIPGPNPEPDNTAPVISEISPIGRSIITKPSYLFTSTESGRLIFDGSCSSEETEVSAGKNSITLNALVEGEYFDCFIRVIDAGGNASESLQITPFSVVVLDHDKDGYATFIEIEYGTDPNDENSTPYGLSPDLIDFTDDNDNDGFSDQMEVWLNTDPNNAQSSPKYEEAIEYTDAKADTVNSSLVAFKINKPSVDLNSNEKNLTIYLSALDNLSGIRDVTAFLTAPSGKHVSSTLYFYDDNTNIQYPAIVVNLDQYAEAGTWKVSLYFQDHAGNSISYSSDQLIHAGYDVDVTIINDSADIEPPVVGNFSLSQSSVDIAKGEREVSFNVDVEEDLSGIRSVTAFLTSPSGKYVSSSIYVDEDDTNTQYPPIVVALDQYAEAGVWKASLHLEDLAENGVSYSSDDLIQSGYDVEVTVINDNADIEPPVVESFSLSQSSVDIAKGEREVSFNVDIEENLSGIRSVTAFLTSPSGKDVYSIFYVDEDDTNTQYPPIVVSLGQYAEAGVWKASLYLEDFAENGVSYSSDDLIQAGYDVEVTVFSE